jgi:hypothetical protein
MPRTSKSAALRGPLRKNESRNWSRAEDDFYVEPAWVSARLFAVESFEGGVVDPACGSGMIIASAVAAGIASHGCDIRDRGALSNGVARDFLTATAKQPNFVCNPPFGIAERFVAHALNLAERKVAMLLPSNWVQGDKRARWLATTPLRRVWFIAPRPSMPPGDVALTSKPGNGTTDYAWFVWLQNYAGHPEIRWLHRDLERAA